VRQSRWILTTEADRDNCSMLKPNYIAAVTQRCRLGAAAVMDLYLAIARALASTYPIEDIVGHCHISPELRQEPGPLFPLAEVVPAALRRPSSLPPCGVPAS